MSIAADIVIVGAGVAGCTAALALQSQFSQSGARIILIDKRACPEVRIGECLAASARRVLNSLDLLNEFEQSAHLDALGTVSHWGSEQAQISDHIRNPDGYPKLLDRAAFEAWLRCKAEQRGVICMWPYTVRQINRNGELWHLESADGVQLVAPNLIDASGPRAVVARRLGIKRIYLDRLLACWLTLSQNGPSQHSMIAAATNGWWYRSPLPGDKSLLAYHTDADLLPAAVRQHASSFFALASECPALKTQLLTSPETQAPVRVRPAFTSRLTQFSGTGWCALGDAAFSMDPLSSQGMYHAMASAMQLAARWSENANTAFSSYANQQEAIWNQYLRHRTHYYKKESRWLQQDFWRRRCVMT